MCKQFFILLGTTPQRREFEYPRLLSKTSPHAKIVEEFRKKYIEQEAVDTALPCESDSEEETVNCHYLQIPSYKKFAKPLQYRKVQCIWKCDLCKVGA